MPGSRCMCRSIMSGGSRFAAAIGDGTAAAPRCMDAAMAGCRCLDERGGKPISYPFAVLRGRRAVDRGRQLDGTCESAQTHEKKVGRGEFCPPVSALQQSRPQIDVVVGPCPESIRMGTIAVRLRRGRRRPAAAEGMRMRATERTRSVALLRFERKWGVIACWDGGTLNGVEWQYPRRRPPRWSSTAGR